MINWIRYTIAMLGLVGMYATVACAVVYTLYLMGMGIFSYLWGIHNFPLHPDW